ncbi:hypothetical protein AYJ66_17590 [Dietzia cinnamea]|nr:hypothetical protein AYJ66_17590 [Dietzia cinnamea]
MVELDWSRSTIHFCRKRQLCVLLIFLFFLRLFVADLQLGNLQIFINFVIATDEFLLRDGILRFF